MPFQAASFHTCMFSVVEPAYYLFHGGVFLCVTCYVLPSLGAPLSVCARLGVVCVLGLEWGAFAVTGVENVRTDFCGRCVAWSCCAARAVHIQTPRLCGKTGVRVLSADVHFSAAHDPADRAVLLLVRRVFPPPR